MKHFATPFIVGNVALALITLSSVRHASATETNTQVHLALPARTAPIIGNAYAASTVTVRPAFPASPAATMSKSVPAVRTNLLPKTERPHVSIKSF